MCQVTYFQHKECTHTWAAISEPCAPYMGFTTCPEFTPGGTKMLNTASGKIKPKPKFYKTKTRPCPRCELLGQYDRNAVRMVDKMGYGLTMGFDPDGGDWGIDFRLGTSNKCVIL